MKSKFLTLVLLCTVSISFAQTNGFSYKALITDNGTALNGQNVNLRFTILQNGTSSVYQETQSAITDANGILAVNVGEGTVISGDFSMVNWGASLFYLKVEIDTGSGFVDFGTAEFKYVPYAKFAEKAGNVFSGDFTDLNNVPAGLADGDDNTQLTEIQVDAMVANNGYLTSEVDGSTINELQTISKDANNVVTLSNGGGSFIDADTHLADTEISAMGYIKNANDADNDPTNEIELPATAINGQVLTWNGTNWVAQNAGTGADNWGTQVVVSDASLTGDGTSGNPLAIDDTSSVFNGWDKDASDDFDGDFTHLTNVPAGLDDGDDDTHLTDAQIAAMGYTKNAGDADFYTMTTTNQPTAITDDIYHTGKIAIGTTQSDASTNDKLTVTTNQANGYAISAKQSNTDDDSSEAVAHFEYQNTKISSKLAGFFNDTSYDYYYVMKNEITPGMKGALGIYNKFFLNTEGYITGVNNYFSGTMNNGVLYGTVNSFATDGNAIQTGELNFMAGTNSSIMTGVSNIINNSGNLYHYGVTSRLNGSGSGAHYGASNELSGDGTGEQYGVYNDISNSKNATHCGVWNSLSGTGTGRHIGVNNYLTNDGSGTYIGTNNNVEGNGNGIHVGSYNYLIGSGTGDKYGTRNVIRSDAAGKHYAVYGEATKYGTDVYAGYFLGKVSIGSSATENYIMPSSNGNAGQFMQIDANRQVNWVDLPTNTDNWGSQTVVSDATLLGDGTTANPLTIDINSSVFSGWDKDASDDFSGDYDDLINQPITFYKVNTTSAPTSINDTIFTHGNIGIGDISPSSPLSIMTDSRFAIDVYFDDSTDANHVGNNVEFYNNGNGSITGFQVIDNNSGNGNRVGQDIHLQGTGSGGKIGVNSSIFGGSGSATYMGVKSTISSNNTGAHYGVYSELTGTGNGDKYGSYNTIDVSAGGTHYAVYGDAQKSGSYAGYFVGEVNVSQGYLTVEQKVISPLSGDTDLKAYIYGYVDINGDVDLSKSSSGFTCSYNSSDMCYDIVFDDLSVENYIAVADVNSVEPLIVTVDRQTGICKIYVYDLNSTLAISDFHFVVYKK